MQETNRIKAIVGIRVNCFIIGQGKGIVSNAEVYIWRKMMKLKFFK